MSNSRGGIRYHENSSKIQIMSEDGVWGNVETFDSSNIYPLIPRMEADHTPDNSIILKISGTRIKASKTAAWSTDNASKGEAARLSGGVYYEWYATQHDNESQFAGTGESVYWQICFATKKVYIDHFELRSPSSGYTEEYWTNSSCQFILQGSDDGVTFINITRNINCWTDTGDATARTRVFRLHDRLNDSAYNYYRIQFIGKTHPGSTTNSGAGFSNIQFYGYYVK